jgi:ribosome maturation factor RimP
MTDRTELLAMLEPEIRGLGYELVDLELHTGGSGVLRLFIDSDDGITVDDCARVSHQVSGILEVEDPIPGHYVLEVSSPGVNRKLRTRQHFEKFVGERLKLELDSPREDGRRRYAGVLKDVGESGIEVEVDRQRFQFSFQEIGTAQLTPRIKV